MMGTPPQDDDLSGSEILWSPNLDARWRQLRRHISPFERDRTAYHSAKYQKPVCVLMSPFAWRRLVDALGAHRAVDLMLMLGFAPAPEDPAHITEWAEREASAAKGPAAATAAAHSFVCDSAGRGVRFRVLTREAPKCVHEARPPGAADGSSASRIRDLEAEVRELTRQVRLLKSRESEPFGAPAPQPHVGTRHDRPLVASTTCHSLVCLPVNYLDPDCAPYVVSLAAHTGRILLACTIVEHRYVIFVAPPHPRGSLAVVLLCSRDGTLRPYARAVWLEYRLQDPPNTLTHHAVNQLLQEIPLPSSATAADANPSEAKSESAFEDDNLFCDTDTLLSAVSDRGLEVEPHMPLTKEMLELIPNSVITRGLSAARTAGTSRVPALDGTLSVTASDWADAAKRGSAASDRRGPHTTSGGSDAETTTLHAGGAATLTERSNNSTAMSVMSMESESRNSNAPGRIMSGRGWVRRGRIRLSNT